MNAPHVDTCRCRKCAANPVREPQDPIEALGQVAAEATMRGAVEYLRANGLEADLDALAACCRSWAKARLGEALRDAKDAIACGMDKIATTTFVATMRLAGVEAAKEAGFPKGGVR